jgi:hypothetical protein
MERDNTVALALLERSGPGSPLNGLDVDIRVVEDDGEVALLTGSFERAVAARRCAGNLPYVASTNGEAVAYAWVATDMAHLGDLGLSFALHEGDRFVCSTGAIEPRGYELIPELLHLAAQAEDCERTWVVARPDAGLGEMDLERAGFSVVAVLSFEPGAGVRVVSSRDRRTQRRVEKLLGLEPAPAFASGRPRKRPSPRRPVLVA